MISSQGMHTWINEIGEGDESFHLIASAQYSRYVASPSTAEPKPGLGLNDAESKLHENELESKRVQHEKVLCELLFN